MPRATGKQPPAGGARLPRPSRPLLAAAIRPAAAVLLVACVAVVVLLGAWFQHRSGPGPLDRAIDDRLHAVLRGQLPLMRVLAHLGVLVPVAAMTAVLVAACLATRRWRGALLVAVAVPASAALTEVLLKPLIHRTIGGYPGFAGWLSFPSGRATGAFTIAAAVAVLLIGPVRPQVPAALRVLLAACAFLLAAGVAVAAVALKYHYFTDTVGGAAVGVGTVLATALIIDRLSSWRSWQRLSPGTPAELAAVTSGASSGREQPQAGPG